MIDKDAFSSGQISSKLWLCEELENLKWKSDLTAIYGGWYGLTAFLLLSRGKFKVKKIFSYDIDPLCKPIADMLNENWVIQNWMFKAHTLDCSTLDSDADLIINTSSEHFKDLEWFERIKTGKRVIIQGNNMKHDDHFVHSESLEHFQTLYPLRSINYIGQLDFTYPDWSFSRFMIIGKK